MALELVIKVRTEGYNRAMSQVKSGAQKTIPALSQVKSLIGTMFVGFSAAIVVNELRKALIASNEFEAGLIGIGKTAGLTQQELDVLGDELDRLSRMPGMPQAEQLLEIGKVAGQLGIRGVADIALFTETMAKLGSATDLVGEEGATALAKLLNITGESASSIDVLGSVIVALGNAFATTESKIAFTAGEVARATAVFDISSAQAAAFATVLSAFGVRAELAGSSIGRAFRTIESAVKSGGEEMQALAKISRVSSDEIADAFGRSPVEAFNLFLKGVRDIQAEGGNVAKALESVGLKGEEVLKVIPLLAKEFDTLAKAQAIAAAETENATALEEEFAKSAASRAASVQRLGNVMGSLSRVFIEDFAVAVAAGADALSDGLESVIGWIDRGRDLERLLDDLAPAAERTATGFRNLADEIERSAKAQTVIDLQQQYNLLFDELQKAESQLASLGGLGVTIENSGILGDRIFRLRDALGEMTERMIKARLALGETGEEEEKVAKATGKVTLSVEEMDKAWAKAITRLNDARDRLFEVRELLRDLVQPGGVDFGAIAGDFISQDIDAQLAPPIISAIETAFMEVNYDQVFGDAVTESLVAAMDTAANAFKEKMGAAARFVGENWKNAMAAASLAIFDAIKSGDGSQLGAAGAGIGGALAGGAALAAGLGPLGQAAAQIGGEIVGEMIGNLIGGLFGGADEGLASLRQAGQDVAIQITRDEGGLGGIMQELGDAFNRAFEGIEGTLRGQIDIAGFDAKIRDGVISIFVNGITGTFDNIADAVNFALVESIRGATFFGAGPNASPEVLAVLERFTGDSIEILNEELAKAISLQEIRQGPIITATEAKVQELFELLQFAIEKGIDGAGVIGALGEMRDSILGVAQSAKERKAAEIDAFNVSIETRIAILKAEDAVAQARIAGANVLLDTVGASVRALDIFGQQIAGVAQISIAATGGIANAIAGLEALLIGAGDRAAAIRAVGGRRGGGVGDGGRAAREAARAGFRDQIRLLELITSGASDAELAAFNFAETTRELMRSMNAAGLSTGEQSRLLGLLQLQEEQRIQTLADEAAALEVAEAAAEAAAELAAAAAEAEAELSAARQLLTSRIGAERDQIEELADAFALLSGRAESVTRDLTDAAAALDEAVGGRVAGTVGFLAQALGDEEALADLRRVEFLIELEFHRSRIALLEAQGLLTDEQGARLAELFAQVDENLDAILAGFGAEIEDAANVFAGVVIQAGNAFGNALQALPLLFPGLLPIVSPGPIDPNAVGLQLAQLLQQITGLGGGPGAADPFDAALEQLALMAPFLEAFGLSLEDLTAEIEAARAAVDAGAWASSVASVDAFLESLRTGPQSGLTLLQQAGAAEDELMRLIRLASAGDVDAANQLAAQGQQLLNLSAGSLGFGAEAALRQQLQELLAPFGSQQVADPILNGIDEADRNQAQRDGNRDGILESIDRRLRDGVESRPVFGRGGPRNQRAA